MENEVKIEIPSMTEATLELTSSKGSSTDIHEIPLKRCRVELVDEISTYEECTEPSDSSDRTTKVELEFEETDENMNATTDDTEGLGHSTDTNISDSETQERAFQDLFIDGFYYCDKCPSKIQRKDNFRRHYLKVHKLTLVDKSIQANVKNKCIFPGCDKAFYHKSRMMQHLQDEHQIAVESETKTFDSMGAFYEWKESEETTNFVYFPRKESRATSNDLRHETYVCQYKGKRQPAAFKHSIGKGKAPKKHSVCPARMLVTIKTSKKKVEVSLKYIKSHNHPICCEDIKNKPISNKMKDEIKEKLLENKSIDDVISELQQEVVDEPSGSSLQKVYMERHRVRYIQQKLKLPKSNNEKSTAMTIEDRLKSLTTPDFNPILLYKPTPAPFESDESTSENETFIFGIQTKEQSQLFQKYASGIVLLELAIPSTFIPYYILTVKVVDEVKQAYNVAHLISSVKNDEAATSFFTAMKARCTNTPNINLVMTTLDTYGVEQFQNVFGADIQFIYSKWHFHKLIFSKLQAECPEEEELRHQVYFTLVALMEQRDPENFKVIASDFFHSYKSKCVSIVTFMADLYLTQPEKWALCYRKPEFHHCDIFMHINTTIQTLRFAFGSLKEQMSIGTLLHTLLNNDHSTYLKQRCQQQLAEIEPSSHVISLRISDDDLNKISDTQWFVTHDESVYEVNWNSDGCLEEFCPIRCLELLCFGLCEHMYTCNCQADANDICPHIHKVHSFEMGVSHCQQTPGTGPELSELNKNNFKLYARTSKSKKEAVHSIETNLEFLQGYIAEDPSQELLDEIKQTLDHLKTICQNSKRKKL